MAFDPNIPNAERYNEEMRKSLIDKIYFLDKIDAGLLLDYGCADGIMLKHIKANFPSTHCIGFDISQDAILRARSDNTTVLFTTDWEEAIGAAEHYKKTANSRTCLVLSSVIHEIYSYGSPQAIEEFWHRIWNSGFDFIAIRDMMVSRAASRQSDPLMVARIHQIYDKQKLTEWQGQWGSLSENWSLVHFLLTYRYEENWARELKENYLPLSLEDFLPMIPKKYMPQYMEHYTLPFIRNKVREDFGIELGDRTHLKLILRRA